MTQIVFEIAGAVQSYDWGAIGASSKCAEYAECIPGFEFDAKKPYAELWMGTHPSLPSKLKTNQESLLTLLQNKPELLGDKVVSHFKAKDLPFLFKVLAIGKALSIQAHPDKELGKKLHTARPDVYKDPNHKPEMAIALTAFSGFCGFRPLPQINAYLDSVPEFKAAVGASVADAFIQAVASHEQDTALLQRNATSVKDGPCADAADLQSALKALFEALMQADPEETVKPQVRALVARYKKETGATTSADLKEGKIEELVLRLNEQFPDDVGIFCSYLLNVVTLLPGEACFLQANEPHAYLSGNIIECMATSDNVVRAGLTPKLRDVPTLVDMLTYTWGPPSTQLMTPVAYPVPDQLGNTTLYDPPIEEFSVLLIDLVNHKTTEKEEVLPAVQGPGVLIITQLQGDSATLSWGEGYAESVKIQKAGQTFFVGAGTSIKLTGSLVAYEAFVEAN